MWGMPRSGATTPANEPSAAPSASATLIDDGIERRSDDQLLSRGQVVGRYVILERVGAGGMGVVYAAYDRDLDRRVAIKLLHSSNRPDRTKGQSRLLREAQAMARLAHPNVVGVHEASTFQDRLFIAMEFVDGQTLGQWSKAETRSWRAVVSMMLQAGRGLAAAHQQGLVHRDFKPENVLVGHDGRARVVDFGLARSVGEMSRDEPVSQDSGLSSPDSMAIRLTETGALAGTPAYMAPEQHRGQAPEARTDQFSYCVTLWEALYDQRPFSGDTRMQLAMSVCRGTLTEPPSREVPAFVRKVLRRGLSVDVDQRFPTMDALLDALERDPVRTRRRVLVAGAAAVGIASLSAAAARWSETPVDPCTAGETRVQAAWSDDQRRAVHTAFDGIDAEFAAASLTTVMRELDDYASRWTHGYRDACEATHVRHEQSTELLDRRMICLSGRLAAMEATTQLLGEADRDAVTHSVRAVNALPPLEECARADHLMARFAPPTDAGVAREVEQLRADLARAEALGLTGQFDAGLVLARQTHARAIAIDHPPLVAETTLHLGSLTLSAGQPHEALPLLHEAVDAAVASGHDEVLVRAALRLVSVIGVSLSRYAEAERWARLATAAVRRRGDEMDDTINLARGMCMMLADKGDATTALPHCRDAVDRSTRHHGAEHSITGMAYRALGNAYFSAGDGEAAGNAWERATDLFLQSHGVDHPEYPALLNSLAAACHTQGRGEACVGLFEETLEAAVRSYGPEHPAVADFTNNLAIVLLDRGRLDEAEARAQASLRLRQDRFGDDHPGVGAAHRVLAQVADQRGDPDGARYHADKAVEVLRATRGPNHPDVLAAVRIRAGIRLRRDEVDEGIADWEEALRLADALDRPAGEHATILFALAQALVEHRPEATERARGLAARAEVQADETLAATIATWRAQQPP